MDYREFSSRQELEAAGLDLLREAFTAPEPLPRAIMLTGGSTPFGIYQALAGTGIQAQAGVHVFLSDERYVPLETGDSNYGRMRSMLDAVGIVKRYTVDSSVPPAIAASRYAADMEGLVAKGIPVTLAILGLGADGHLAALFSADQIAQAKGKMAVAVNRPDGMTGISLGPDMLCRSGQIVFWVCGEGKRAAVDALLNRPSSIPAGIALDGAQQVSVWYSPQD